VIPKIESAEQIRRVSQVIASHETQNGWPVGGICLLVVVETARGIVSLANIAAADSRLQVIIFGAEDFAGDIGATRTAEGWEVFYARSAVVTHAAANELQAIDMVYIDFHDLDGLNLVGIHGGTSHGLGAERGRLAPRQRAGIDLLMRSTMSGGTKFTSSVLSASTRAT
jgi:citrate lyase beta subunit